MLSTADFNSFIGMVREAYSFFKVWEYTNNNYANHQKAFNNGHTEEIRSLAFFWDITCECQKRSWILAIAKLTDESGYQQKNRFSIICKFLGLRVKNSKNQGTDRLSIKYIIKQLGDEEIRKFYMQKIGTKEMKDFRKSNRLVRNQVLAHKNVNPKTKTQEAGVEDFFKIMDLLIELIKSKDQMYASCKTIDRDRRDKISQTGAKEIFEKIST